MGGDFHLLLVDGQNSCTGKHIFDKYLSPRRREESSVRRHRNRLDLVTMAVVANQVSVIGVNQQRYIVLPFFLITLARDSKPPSPP